MRKTAPRPVVLSPSDVAGSKRRGTVRVGGRVADLRGEVVVVADALAALRVKLSAPANVSPGDLVVVEGRRVAAAFTGRVVERFPGRPPSAASEHGRLALSGVGANLVARARAVELVRGYFAREGFLEVTTPTRVATPGLDAHVDAIPAEGGHLVTSPELHMKRLVVGGLPRVFQIAVTSRKDEQGSLHEPEFAMLEWYRGFSGMDSVLRDTEELVVRVVKALSGRAAVVRDGRRVSVRAPFERLTVRDAFRRHAGIHDAVALAARDPDRYFELFVDRVEPALAAASRPLFVTEFPATQAALARRCAHDATVAERFELYLAGVELCNGFGELTDPAEQRTRFIAEQDRRRRAGSPVYPLDEPFLASLQEGLPPTGGNALGLDRLIALALGAKSIAEVMAFPATSSP